MKKILTRKTLGLVAAAGAALLLGTAGLAHDALAANTKSIGVISAKVGACAFGFKQVKKDKRGNYMCVSVPIKCPNKPYGYHTIYQRYNKATKRFEYTCAVPVP